MIKLNLLPPWKKEEIKWEKINRILTVNEVIVAIELAVFIAAFLLAQIYLSGELSHIDQLVVRKQQEAEIKEVEELKNEVKIFNEQLNLVGELHSQRISWTEILNELSLITPETVQITSLNIKRNLSNSSGKKKLEGTNINSEGDEKKCHFNLSGYAKTRDNLLKFEDNLKNSGYFTNLKSDRSNYLKARNVDFSCEFDLSEEVLGD